VDPGRDRLDRDPTSATAHPRPGTPNLRAAGAPRDYRAALFAYNHADWYVADLLAKAALYRGAPRPGTGLTVDRAAVGELLRNPRIVLTPVQRTDLLAGGIDPRLIATLAAIGRRHTVAITALRADHAPGTNHEAGRAIDIGAVDGELCDGRRTGPCAERARARRRRGPVTFDRADLLLGP
jgi:hypothetical protein